MIGVVRDTTEAAALTAAGVADEVIVADARDATAVCAALGAGADLTVVCVNVPGCEMAAIKGTKDGGEVLFFSMASDFQEAALGAEGAVKDVTMLIGSGYVPGHAEYALDVYRQNPGIQQLFRAHLG